MRGGGGEGKYYSGLILMLTTVHQGKALEGKATQSGSINFKLAVEKRSYAETSPPPPTLPAGERGLEHRDLAVLPGVSV